jgi:hypothetical protein
MDTTLVKEFVLEKLFEYFQHEQFQKSLEKTGSSLIVTSNKRVSFKSVDIETKNSQASHPQMEEEGDSLLRHHLMSSAREAEANQKYIDEILFTFIEILAKIMADELYVLAPKTDRSNLIYERCVSLFGEYIIPHLKAAMHNIKSVGRSHTLLGSFESDPLLSFI